MNVKISDTSSIFQLALGVNAVFAILLNHYLSQRNNLLKLFAEKIQEHKPDFHIAGKEDFLIKYMSNSMAGYRFFNKYFIVCAIISASSIMFSFYWLLQAAIYPTWVISARAFVFVSTVLIIVNPVVYFSFFKLTETLLLALRTKFTIKSQYIPFIEDSIDTYELIERANNIIINSKRYGFNKKIEAIKSRVHNTLKILLHPIDCLKKRRTERFIEDEINKLKSKKREETRTASE